MQTSTRIFQFVGRSMANSLQSCDTYHPTNKCKIANFYIQIYEQTRWVKEDKYQKERI